MMLMLTLIFKIIKNIYDKSIYDNVKYDENIYDNVEYDNMGYVNLILNKQFFF